MTQAPTPGPLSVGDRVIAIADLRQVPNGAVWIKESEEAVIVREFGVSNCLVGVLTDEGHEGEWAKTCFRLAPTAPVEASGSEREAMEAVMASVDPATWPGLSADHRAALGRFAKPQDLRPQPSGEMRSRLEEMATWLERGDEGAEGSVLLSASVAAEHAKDILALIRPAPVASGGQHDSGEVDRAWLIDIINEHSFASDAADMILERLAAQEGGGV